MTGDKLTLEYDEDDRAVWLIVEAAAGIRHKEPIWLRKGFGIDDVHQAVMATGWVGQEGDELHLTRDIRCEVMRDVVDEMLGYFLAPGVPGSELLDVQSAVAGHRVMQQSSPQIPLYAYAWLDVMLREEIADKARSANGIWTSMSVVVELESICARRVEELVLRYSQPTSSVHGRMARSSRKRVTGNSPNAEAG